MRPLAILSALPILTVLNDHAPDEPFRCTTLHGGTRLVTFAGTRNWRDVMDDLDIRSCDLVSSRAGQVHCGIAQRTERLWHDSRELQNFCTTGPNAPPIVLGGYSLGGGVAICSAALLCEQKNTALRSIYTFGSPKIGDSVFRKWYASSGLWSRTHRFVTASDPVPRLPPQAVFQHVGRRILVPPMDGGRKRPNSLFESHRIETYMSGLRNMTSSR